MRCPHCSHSQSKVIDSRETVDSIRRRRECSYCDRRYTTYERVQSNSLQVVKRDERREEFSSDKLRVSILKACTKRPLPTGSIDKLVGEIEGDLYALGLSEIPSHTIGESVVDRLREFDRVAYIRYASVYRDFQDIQTFRQEIDALLDPETQEPINQLSFLGSDVGVIKAPSPERRGRRTRQADPGED